MRPPPPRRRRPRGWAGAGPGLVAAPPSGPGRFVPAIARAAAESGPPRRPRARPPLPGGSGGALGGRGRGRGRSAGAPGPFPGGAGPRAQARWPFLPAAGGSCSVVGFPPVTLRRRPVPWSPARRAGGCACRPRQLPVAVCRLLRPSDGSGRAESCTWRDQADAELRSCRGSAWLALSSAVERDSELLLWFSFCRLTPSGSGSRAR